MEQEPLTYEEFCAKYSKRGNFFGYQSKKALLCAVIELCAIVLIVLFAGYSYAYFRTVIGGETYAEETQSLPAFLVDRWKEIEGAVQFEGDEFSAALDILTLGQPVAALAGAASVAVLFAVSLILTAVKFFGRKTSLHTVLTGLVCRFLPIPLILYCVFDPSGGSGAAAYSVGYAAGTGYLIAMGLGETALIVCAVLSSAKSGKGKRAILCGSLQIVFSAAAFVFLLRTAPERFLSQGGVSGLLSLVSSLSGGISVGGLGFPILNFMLFVSICSLFALTANSQKQAWDRLLADEKSETYLKRKKSGVSFAVWASAALLCALLLRIPSLGYGQKNDMLFPLIVCFCCAVGFCILNKAARKPEGKGRSAVAPPGPSRPACTFMPPKGGTGEKGAE